MIAQQVAGKAARDALFLSTHDATELPRVMLAAAALALVCVGAIARAMSVLGPRRVAPVLFLLSGALFAVEAALHPRYPAEVAYGLYLHMSAIGAVMVSGFWSLVNERFDPHTFKRIIGRVAAGATAGGVVGGVAADRVSAAFGTGALLPMLAGLGVAGAVFLLPIGGSGARPDPEQASTGFEALRTSPFLRRVGAMVVLLALVGAFLDYALKAEADLHLDTERLPAFFARYYAVIGVATFLVQTLMARPVLARAGLGGALAALPLVLLGASAVAAAITHLWSVVVLRGAGAVLESSIHRSSYELLYTPVAPEKKRPAKLLIDVAGSRIGDAVGSGVMLGLLVFVDTEIAVRIAIVLGGLAAALALALVAQLARGYVGALGESLRTGAVNLDEEVDLDATTRRTLAETTLALDREKLLAEIAELRRKRGETEAPGIADVDTDFRAALQSEDPARIRGALLGKLDAEQVALALPLLDGPHQGIASHALSRSVSEHLALLARTLRDPQVPLGVRRRLPRVFAASSEPAAVRGLMMALDDEDFELRFRAGRALSRLCARRPRLTPVREAIFAVAMREMAVDQATWLSRQALEMGEGDQSVDRSLEHVLTVLSVCLEQETLRLAIGALRSGAPILRGTALEYLENVLPENLRDALWPHLERKRSPQRRPKAVIVDELLRSMDSLQIDREALMREPDETSS